MIDEEMLLGTIWTALGFVLFVAITLKLARMRSVDNVEEEKQHYKVIVVKVVD
jgi:hypothetical protein